MSRDAVYSPSAGCRGCDGWSFGVVGCGAESSHVPGVHNVHIATIIHVQLYLVFVFFFMVGQDGTGNPLAVGGAGMHLDPVLHTQPLFLLLLLLLLAGIVLVSRFSSQGRQQG